MIKKVDFNINVLRIVAIILVILLHANAMYLMPIKEGKVGIISSIVIISISVITRIAVPIFVLISGRYVIESLSNISVKEFYKKRILRLIYPLIFWSILFGTLSLALVPGTTIKTYFIDFISGFANNMTAIHIWYLYMLLGLYLVSPIIYTFIKNMNQKKLLIIGSILTLFGFLVEIFKNKTGINLWILWWLEFLGLFIMGYALRGIKIKSKNYLLIIIGIIQVISSAICCYLFSVGSSLGMVFFWGLTPTTTITAILVYLYFENNTMQECIVSKDSKYVLGVYLLHPIILILIKNLSMGMPVIEVILKTIIAYLISLFIIKLLYKIKFMRKFIS
ncbi:MAG: acyltransferase [Clostridium sp.]